MVKNLKINYYGYFTPFGGYGIANINWVKHLRRLGVDVSVHPKFKPEEGSKEWEILDDEERDMFKQPFVKRRIGIVEATPFDFDTNVSDIRIANTMCESDKVSDSWAEKLNGMDHILVPNQFCKNVFLDAGVTKPIKVLPHGVDTKRYSYFHRPYRPEFTFGTLGYLDVTDRKGAFDVIQAFVSEFDKDEPVRLILKSSDPLFGYYKNFSDPRIKVVTEQLSFPEVNAFYRTLDCFVFPSKAEGVGYPPREAMATGLPVIMTNWSGLEDIAQSGVCYPLEPKSLEPRPNFIEQNGNWAKIDIRELMFEMRYVYQNRMEAFIRGKHAADEMELKHSWEDAAEKMVDFLQTL